MEESNVSLCVPAKPSFARSVRMMSASLAVLCAMNVDDVEDARMVAEEAFVYACATRPGMCDITFKVSQEGLTMAFSLGGEVADDPELAEQAGLAKILLSAVSDSFEISQESRSLRVSKLAGAAHAE